MFWLPRLVASVPLIFPESPHKFEHRVSLYIEPEHDLRTLEDAIDAIDSAAYKSVRAKTTALEKRAQAKTADGVPDDQFSPLVMEPAIDLALDEEVLGQDILGVNGTDLPQAQGELNIQEQMIERWANVTIGSSTTSSTSTTTPGLTGCLAEDVEMSWCPRLWVAIGRECVPTARWRFRADCEGLRHAQSLSIEDRVALSHNCRTPFICVYPRHPDFPCASPAQMNLTRVCPLGFRTLNASHCVSYTQPGVTVAINTDKPALIATRNFTWPCLTGLYDRIIDVR